MKKLYIVGASGHGKVVADIAMLNGYERIEFLDDNEKLTSCGNYPVVGKSKNAALYEGDVFIAIGNANIRQELMKSIDEKRIPVLIHPSATVAADSQIGKGTVVMAGAIVNPATQIGKGCIINTSSSVDHDCDIDSYVHVSVGAHIAGNVKIGKCTWIGAGATISNNVSICTNCTIGAGAVVVKDILEEGTYVGVPAKRTVE